MEQVKAKVLEIVERQGIQGLHWPLYTGSCTALICPFLTEEDSQGTILGSTKCITGQTVEEILPVIAEALTELIKEGKLKLEIKTEHLGIWITIRHA